MADDPGNTGGNQNQQLSKTLRFNNYLEFKRVLYSYAVRFGRYVVQAVEIFHDAELPPHPGQNAHPDAIRSFRELEKEYSTYQRNCALVCSIIYHSLSFEIKLRIDAHPGAYQAFGFGQLGLFWRYVSEIVRETGQNSIMPMFTKIISHRTNKARQIGDLISKN
jgi:hypothetical protein